MNTQIPSGVFVWTPASLLRVPAPPGVVVVSSGDKAQSAVEIARTLGADRWLYAEDAVVALERRRVEVLATYRETLHETGTRAAAARVRAAGMRPGLSTVPTGLTAGMVRAAARRVAECKGELHAARELVGIRPMYDEATGSAARAADAEAKAARRACSAALPRLAMALAVASLAAGSLVVGRLLYESLDGVFFLIALLPLAALIYSTQAVIAPAHRARVAARRRWAALRSIGVSTFGALAALEDRSAEWVELSLQLHAAAEQALQAALGSWHDMVGDAVALTSVERLAADLEAVAAATSSTELAWALSAAALQAAEDTFGADQRPIVVLNPDPIINTNALQRLAAAAGRTTVVVVTADPQAEQEAAPAPATRSVRPITSPRRAAQPVRCSAPIPAAGATDLRERLKAGWQRLRRQANGPSVHH